MTENLKFKRLGIFLGGILFGTAGIKVLSGSRAKKVYTKGMAAALRAKDEVVKKATIVQENAEDIIYEAKLINKEKARRERAKAAAEEFYNQSENDNSEDRDHKEETVESENNEKPEEHS